MNKKYANETANEAGGSGKKGLPTAVLDNVPLPPAEGMKSSIPIPGSQGLLINSSMADASLQAGSHGEKMSPAIRRPPRRSATPKPEDVTLCPPSQRTISTLDGLAEQDEEEDVQDQEQEQE